MHDSGADRAAHDKEVAARDEQKVAAARGRWGSGGWGSVALGRCFPSDTGTFADWVASSTAAMRWDDLSLGFNGSAAAAASASSAVTKPTKL
jgi:hypothetical protein